MSGLRRVVPARVRKRLHDVVPWRPWPSEVRIDRLLLGLQNGTPAAEFAARFDDPLWPSTRVADGPHVGLLRLSEGRELSDDDILASDYAVLGRRCIELRGFFFWATDDAGIAEVARNFIAGYRDGPAGRPPRAHQSAAHSPIRVAPIADSDCFQALDGHHRLALAVVRGEAWATVRQKWIPVRTPLQRLVLAASDGHELAQPVDAPELQKSWRARPGCTQRFAQMSGFLAAEGLLAARTTYLDLPSSYGWFVAEMGSAGFIAEGVDGDRALHAVGRAAYGLGPTQLHAGEPLDFLRASTRSWDVVSSFGLLPRTWQASGRTGVRQLLAGLDRATARVLFLDSEPPGYGGETSAPVLTPAELIEVVVQETSFDRAVDLGTGVEPNVTEATTGAATLLAFTRA